MSPALAEIHVDVSPGAPKITLEQPVTSNVRHPVKVVGCWLMLPSNVSYCRIAPPATSI